MVPSTGSPVSTRVRPSDAAAVRNAAVPSVDQRPGASSTAAGSPSSHWKEVSVSQPCSLARAVLRLFRKRCQRASCGFCAASGVGFEPVSVSGSGRGHGHLQAGFQLVAGGVLRLAATSWAAVVPAAAAASGSPSSTPLARPPSSTRVRLRASWSGSPAPARAARSRIQARIWLLVGHGPVVDAGAGGRLGGRVDEGAAAVAVAPAGGCQGIEQAHELLGRVLAGGFGGGMQLPGPDAVDLLQVGQDEVVLGRKVLVERGFRDAGLGDDRVDAGGPETLRVEEPEGRGQDLFPGMPGRGAGGRRRRWLLAASWLNRTQTSLSRGGCKRPLPCRGPSAVPPPQPDACLLDRSVW